MGSTSVPCYLYRIAPFTVWCYDMAIRMRWRRIFIHSLSEAQTLLKAGVHIIVKFVRTLKAVTHITIKGGCTHNRKSFAENFVKFYICCLWVCIWNVSKQQWTFKAATHITIKGGCTHNCEIFVNFYIWCLGFCNWNGVQATADTQGGDTYHYQRRVYVKFVLKFLSNSIFGACGWRPHGARQG